MNIIINQKKLFTSLKNAERIVSKNNSLPILQTVLLKTEGSLLNIYATNLEIGVNYAISAKVNQPGSVAVPAKIFSDFINNINDEKVEIIVKNNVLNINSEKYKTQILCFNPGEFPIIPTNKNIQKIKINSSLLKNSLLSVIDSASLSDTRPELSGVYFNLNEQKVEMASTDSYRLSEKVFESNNTVLDSCIIPRNTALELIRILDINLEVSISFSDNQIFIESEDFKLVSRLIDGRYPDYKRIIPEKFISMARVLKVDLEKGIKTASVFSSNISDIKILVSAGKLEIMAKNSDKGEINATLACELKNEPFELKANYNYIIDGLKAIDTDYVILHYTGEGSPMVMKAENKNDFTYLIMPLRS